MKCKHLNVREYTPSFYNDFVYNPSSFECLDCGKRWKAVPGESERNFCDVVDNVVEKITKDVNW